MNRSRPSFGRDVARIRRRIVLVIALAALGLPGTSVAAPRVAPCSSVTFHRQVSASVDKMQEAFDWYQSEAYRAAIVAASRAEQMARAQRPCTAEDRRVKALQVNTYVALRKAFDARRREDLGSAAVWLARADSHWEKLTVIAARW